MCWQYTNVIGDCQCKTNPHPLILPLLNIIIAIDEKKRRRKKFNKFERKNEIR